MTFSSSLYDGASPGLMLGISMVKLALHTLGQIRDYHAIAETDRDLPEAIRRLTPCSTSNGRLHVLRLDTLALTLVHRLSGRGVRVYLDREKAAAWPLILRWSLHPDSYDAREEATLKHAIRKAGISVLSLSPAAALALSTVAIMKDNSRQALAPFSSDPLIPAPSLSEQSLIPLSEPTPDAPLRRI